MSAYKNFTVELPERIQNLDKEFSQLAKVKNLEVTYLLMKLAAAFLLPYERISGTSGATSFDIVEPQRIRRTLELDKQFYRSSYPKNIDGWVRYDVNDFSNGPCGWLGQGTKIETDTVAIVLKTIRHAIAHSNLYFGGEGKDIEHIFFGNRQERDRNTNNYTVIRCDISELNQMLNSWLTTVVSG